MWNHYFAIVVRLARSRMQQMQCLVYDEEDAALSSMRSIFRGLGAGRFPDLQDRQDLWQLIVVITRRKIRAEHRRGTATRRGGNAFAERWDIDIEEIVADEPTPESVASMMDDVSELLDRLDDDRLKKIAMLKMDGFTNDEIAQQLGCTSRTVTRKLDLIRAVWGDPTVE